MKASRNEIAVKEQMTDEVNRARTTIGIKKTTKDRLDKNRAPGQCYNGFLGQLVDLWERANSK